MKVDTNSKKEEEFIPKKEDIFNLIYHWFFSFLKRFFLFDFANIIDQRLTFVLTITTFWFLIRLKVTTSLLIFIKMANERTIHVLLSKNEKRFVKINYSSNQIYLFLNIFWFFIISRFSNWYSKTEKIRFKYYIY